MDTLNCSQDRAGVGSASSAAFPVVTLLESTIPGFSLVSRILSDYLHIDISQYFGLVLVFVGIATTVKYVSKQLQSTWKGYCMSTAEVRSDDQLYACLMYWISKNGISKRSTHFMASISRNSSHYSSISNEDDAKEEFEFDDDFSVDLAKTCRNWNRMRTLRCTPYSGTHFFRYKGWWIAFSRPSEKDGGYYSVHEVSLSCFSKNPRILKELLQDAQVAYLDRDGNKTVIYRGGKNWRSNSGVDWERSLARRPRDLSTVILDEGQKRMILADMREYLDPSTKKWYSNRGIPYRRGYLLHGPPGTGKTSLCFALAGLLQLGVYVVCLNSQNLDEEGLAGLFRNLPEQCIVLLEDIDAAGLSDSRQKDEKEATETPEEKVRREREEREEKERQKITLSGFLNIIDGIASSEGRILVMTTNHIEKLDGALLRPGRVDLTVTFGRASTHALKAIFKAIYSTSDVEQAQRETEKQSKGSKERNGAAGESAESDLFHHGKTQSEIEAMAEEFSQKIPADVFTPAEIQGYLLRHKKDPQAVLDLAQELIDQKAVEKEQKTL
jgi:chaperone BCS1